MKYELVISIVIYNNDFSEIKNLISSIKKCSLTKQIVIVDNSSKKMLSNNIVESFNLHYIKTEKNIGFGKAHNLVFDKYLDKAHYFLILNPDIEISSKDIEQAVTFLKDNRNIAILSPRIEHSDVSQHLKSTYHLVPNPFHLFGKRFFYIFFKKYIDKYNLEHMDKRKINFVPNLSGCCMFINANALKKVGKFDERFFLYMEDVDFVRRMAEEFQTIYYPFINVKHKRSSSSYKKIKFLLIHIKSAIKYFNKWGWLFDKKRVILNKKTLSLIKEENQ